MRDNKKMMRRAVHILLFACGLFSCARTESLPVCVVGAGPAGLSAAAELESRGHRTLTFEKQSAVGGKCQAVYEK